MTEDKALSMGVSNDMMTYLQGKTIDDGVDAQESMSVPVLRVIQANSRNTETNDGQDASPGTFLYKPTLQDYKEVVVNLLHVKQTKLKSKVFGSELDEYEDKAHYLITGVIVDTNELFTMYVKGMSYSGVWDLLEMTRPYRKHPSTPMPLFSMNIKLFTEKETSDKGFVNHVIKYSLEREGGNPQIVDLERFKWLEAQVPKAKEMTETLIEINQKYGTDGETEEITIVDSSPTVDPREAAEILSESDEVADDVPF